MSAHHHITPSLGSSGTYLPVKGNISMSSVTFEKATRVFAGQDRPAVNQLDLHVEDVEFLVLVGPSGWGKSSWLRLL